jgi:hypothetical protein
MFGQTVFGFNFIINADCKKRMIEIQQFTKLSNIQSPPMCYEGTFILLCYFISNIIISAVGEMLIDKA